MNNSSSPQSFAWQNLATTREVARAATLRIAPLWPLQSYVAVNPFWGMQEQPFNRAVQRMRKVSHSPLRMPLSFYRSAWEEGKISDEDLQEASRSKTGGAYSLNRLRDFLLSKQSPSCPSKIFTIADFLDARSGTDYATVIAEEISKWCSAYFDQGQAAWAFPLMNANLFAAWKKVAALDRNLDWRGMPGFGDHVASLPNDPLLVISQCLTQLQLPENLGEVFLHRQLMSVGGWAAYLRHIVWKDGLDGKDNDALIDFLAIRLVHDAFLAKKSSASAFLSSWLEENQRAVAEVCEQVSEWEVWQEALEIGFQRNLFQKLQDSRKSNALSSEEKETMAQAVFCIDVRSEVYRRALETVNPRIETMGFAGFFGFPLKVTPLGHQNGPSLCPVLLKPGVEAKASIAGFDDHQMDGWLVWRKIRQHAAKAWKAFKISAVSSFSYVEACGLGFFVKILADTLRWNPASVRSGVPELKETTYTVLKPVAPCGCSPQSAGDQLAKTAAGALKNMGLTKGFARIVLLCGHGSSTTNNPYGSALDCGACGGHAGGANAQFASQTLNDLSIRKQLSEMGILIPDTTWFVAAQHDTTSDEVSLLLSGCDIPESHQKDIQNLRVALATASRIARQHRAETLGFSASAPQLDKAIFDLCKDWSQVRPEWGLAGNAAFIAAPRSRTAGLNLEGRVFLHNYHCHQDADGSILELIMCAPMVVANWINLQYFASTIDNTIFGSGSKVTHNVVGTMGVLQGNGGDLQVGLPWQSIHDGQSYRHDPIRLNVFLETETQAIDSVLQKHATVSNLVENMWLHLFAICPKTGVIRQYLGRGVWNEVSGCWNESAAKLTAQHPVCQ